jgi:RNA polymerase sigma-70 factor, ECF subfamily
MTVTLPTDRTAVFERSRPRLFGIAYRMLGSVEDGEDLVQEAALRWQQADVGAVREPEAWLVTVVTRLSIDRLRRARTEREAYVGQWLPEPLPTAAAGKPDERVELASDLSMAFLVLLERLAPEERAALLLREVFDSEYAEIARVLGKSEAACRQMVHRARERVRREQPRFDVSPEVTERLLSRFLTALHAEDKEGVLALLSDDVTWTADGGGKVNVTTRVVRGARRIARMAVVFQHKLWRDGLTHRLTWLNGEPTWVSCRDDRVYSTTSLLTDGSRIRAVYRVLNPDKLRHVAARVLGRGSL